MLRTAGHGNHLDALFAHTSCMTPPHLAPERCRHGMQMHVWVGGVDRASSRPWWAGACPQLGPGLGSHSAPSPRRRAPRPLPLPASARPRTRLLLPRPPDSCGMRVLLHFIEYGMICDIVHASRHATSAPACTMAGQAWNALINCALRGKMQHADAGCMQERSLSGNASSARQTWQVCVVQMMRRTHLQCFHMLGQQGIIGGANPQLAILVAPEGKEVSAVCDCQRVRIAASYLHDVAAAQG